MRAASTAEKRASRSERPRASQVFRFFAAADARSNDSEIDPEGIQPVDQLTAQREIRTIRLRIFSIQHSVAAARVIVYEQA
jgi:hypothetical protein